LAVSYWLLAVGCWLLARRMSLTSPLQYSCLHIGL